MTFKFPRTPHMKGSKGTDEMSLKIIIDMTD